MIELVRLIVSGTPAPAGSKRPIVHRSTGKAVMMEMSPRVTTWRADVRVAAEQAVCCPCPDNCGVLLAGYPLGGPLFARMVFTFARPRSHYRTGRNAHLLRDGAPARPANKPDLSKLLRSTEDALTGLVWADDALVVDYTRAAKVYAGEDPEALDRPGALIVITRPARPVMAQPGTRRRDDWSPPPGAGTPNHSTERTTA